VPGQSFDRVATIYDATRGGQRRGDFFARAISPWLATSGQQRQLVEVGVGTGLVAAGLRALGHRVVGFDLSDAMLRSALDRLGASVAIADSDALPIADACVDAVILSWVLHLVSDPNETLAEACRVVRPGGQVVAVLSSPESHPDDEIGSIT
jgi:ubiquinone/menaquinone biosynthesis C-methylase UbiE